MCIPTQNDSFFNIKLEKTEVVWYLLTFLLLRNEDMVESYVSVLRDVGGDGDGGGGGVFLVASDVDDDDFVAGFVLGEEGHPGFDVGEFLLVPADHAVAGAEAGVVGAGAFEGVADEYAGIVVVVVAGHDSEADFDLAHAVHSEAGGWFGAGELEVVAVGCEVEEDGAGEVDEGHRAFFVDLFDGVFGGVVVGVEPCVEEQNRDVGGVEACVVGGA